MATVKNKKLGALAVMGAMFLAPTAWSASMTIDTKGGLEVFESDENNYWFKIGGKLYFDQVFFDKVSTTSTNSFPSGANISSARLTLKGGVGQGWIYKLDLDLKDKPGTVQATFGEAFLGYNACQNFWLALGQISIPFGLENWESGNDLPFMEASLPTSAFAPNKGLGVYSEWHGSMVTIAGALYHPQMAGSRQTGDVLANPPVNNAGVPYAGTGPNGSNAGSDDVGLGGRITFSPQRGDYLTYHVGMSSYYEKLHRNANNINYSTGLELQARQTPSMFSNIPPNSSKHHNVWGLEWAGQWGPFLTQAEYFLAKVSRDGVFPASDLRNPAGSQSYSGYYLQGSYVLTGEKRPYDFESGTFGGVHPSSSKGAWELGIRYSYLDLVSNPKLLTNMIFPYVDYVPSNALSSGGNTTATGLSSKNVLLGSAHSTTLGLTWWLNDNVRFMTNYMRTSFSAGYHVDAWGLRAQVTW